MAMCQGPINNCHCTFPLVSIYSNLPALGPAPSQPGLPMQQVQGLPRGVGGGQKECTLPPPPEPPSLCSSSAQLWPPSMRTPKQWASGTGASRPDPTPTPAVPSPSPAPPPRGPAGQPLILCHLTQAPPYIGSAQPPYRGPKMDKVIHRGSNKPNVIGR